ncbi:hypothetical protein [Bdellovibrio sp. HCB337]|uniref:hypothetical protein n=1 Tax=Bdellovibrio sp. HCB337 TaxID=3394358 RepID=UPI0039A69078
MKNQLKTALGALAILLMFSGCQKDRNEAPRDPLDENYKLIDKGDYGQAIQKLQELAVQDPRPQVKVALASAYAARGGIRVEQYWGFVVGFKAPLVPAESLKMTGTAESLQKIAKQAKGDIDPRDMKALGGLVNTLAVWDRYKDRVDSIPVVQGQALVDLKIAVDTLSMVQTPGGRLYRAILNLILFKSYVTASAQFWTDFNKAIEDVIAGRIEVLCRFDFEVLLKWLTPISYHLSETMTDLSIAYPEDSEELLDARAVVQAVYATTLDAVTELRKKRTCQ